jgi:hypothetical protein
MPSPSPLISHGLSGERMRADLRRRRARQIHELEQTWDMDSPDAFTLGDAPPDYPRMRIVEIDPLDTYTSGSHALRIQCEGFLGSETHIETFRRESQPEEGFDTMQLGIITLDPTLPRWMKGAQLQNDSGIVLAGFDRMWITDRDAEELRAKDFSQLSLTYKGLRYDKAVKRRINTTAQALSTSGFASTILIDPLYTGPGSNPTTSSNTTYTLAGNVEFDLPQISVTDTFISTTPPPTALVPSSWIPPDAPTVTVVGITGTNDIYHYPSGWKVLNLVSEQIPDQSLWLISLTWGYQRGNTPQA